jgi:hypothetical protein
LWWAAEVLLVALAAFYAYLAVSWEWEETDGTIVLPPNVFYEAMAVVLIAAAFLAFVARPVVGVANAVVGLLFAFGGLGESDAGMLVVGLLLVVSGVLFLVDSYRRGTVWPRRRNNGEYRSAPRVWNRPL